MLKVYWFWSWSCAALLGCLLAGRLAGIPQTPQTSSASEASRSAQSQPPGDEFEETRRLLQQGKFDDALSALHQLESTHPEMRGLSHELGAAYYKKGDYINAIASLKKKMASSGLPS